MVAGVDVPITWHGRRATAFVPSLLADRDLGLDAPTATRTGEAVAEVVRAAETLDLEYEPLARLLLRSEGVASSHIEGISAPVLDVVLAEEGRARADDAAAAWVAAALAAMIAAIDDAASGDVALDVDALCRWHRLLMTGSPTPERYVGRIRDEQGWIGGTSPFDAHLVTPPADRLPPLLRDLLAWVNRDDVDPIAQAAIAHAQFEIMHPFADGNGRIGRVLIAWILVRRLALLVPPPVSVAIAADVGGYAAGLVRFRVDDHLGWVRWFAAAVSGGGRAQRQLVERVDDLRVEWHARLTGTGLRRDAVAYRALTLLPRHLLLTSTVLVDELGVSTKAALDALRALADAGVLTEHGTAPPVSRGQPARLYVARELLGLAGATSSRA
ncbi:MAG TPA: Fic family protein [Acidimicrobiia bacterium]